MTSEVFSVQIFRTEKIGGNGARRGELKAYAGWERRGKKRIFPNEIRACKDEIRYRCISDWERRRRRYDSENRARSCRNIWFNSSQTRLYRLLNLNQVFWIITISFHLRMFSLSWSFFFVFTLLCWLTDCQTHFVIIKFLPLSCLAHLYVEFLGFTRLFSYPARFKGGIL